MKSPVLKIQLPPDCAEKYDPVRLLGTGGFGAVILCIHRDLDRQVAVKLLHSMAGGDPTVVERLAEEARVTAKLRHANIVQLMDVGASAKTPWVAYEYLEGETVEHRIQQGPIPWREAVQIAIEVARALETAHAARIIHRDIKPENVLRTADGPHKVIDFGIAKWTSSSSVQTQEGLILGTPPYMCPEQIRGKAPSPRFDLYALGIMLYQMVTGELPFYSSNPHDLFRMHLEQAVPRMSNLVADVPALLERLVDNLLEKSEKKSFATATELLVALESLISGEAPAGAGEHWTPPSSHATAVSASPRVTGVTRRESTRSDLSRLETATPPPGRGASVAAACGLLAALMVAGWFVTPALTPPPASPSATSASPEPGESLVPLDESLRRIGLAVEPTHRLPREDGDWTPPMQLKLQEACHELMRHTHDFVEHLTRAPQDMSSESWVGVLLYLGGAADSLSNCGMLNEDPPLPWRDRAWTVSSRRLVLGQWRKLLDALARPELAPLGGAMHTVLSSHLVPSSRGGKRPGDSELHRNAGDACETSARAIEASATDPCLKEVLAILLNAHGRVHIQQNVHKFSLDDQSDVRRIDRMTDRIITGLDTLEKSCPDLPSAGWQVTPLDHLHSLLGDRIREAPPGPLPPGLVSRARRANARLANVENRKDEVRRMVELLETHEKVP